MDEMDEETSQALRARLAALTAERDTALGEMLKWSQDVMRLRNNLAALTAAIAPTHSMPRHSLPIEWQEHIRKIQQAALDAAGG